MICPRCGETIDDIETICPFCLQDIDKNAEFNDYRKDGFVQIQQKNEADTSEPINYMPKYLNIAEFNIFVLAVIFVLTISVFTVFSLRFVQKTNVEVVPAYIVKTEVTTESETTEATEATENEVKGYTIKSLIGSWKIKGSKETANTAIPYYSFADDGVAQENYGSITAAGTYKDVSTGDKKMVFIEIENSFKGTYYFKLTGDEKKGYTLTLEEITTSRTYELVKAEAKAKKISPSDDFKPDKKLIGYWYNEKEKKSYEFRMDGTATRITGGNTTDCVWTVSDENVITIKYMKDEIKSINLGYVIKKNKLLINNTTYEKTNKNESDNTDEDSSEEGSEE